ncbi:hypothetical protein NCCP1664_15700 [Zafaria cholistanensis]|uniref:Glycoside hydrolase family 42 N-terminal domain-containing protein n=1 Tax=Zafaria cholistanensis TaxID=1682741 RepID=A0A5A7NQ58_9MICC|nr:glycosyltransferase [Zafaria cholistanensis]GER23074.1 hypothetical protein NCCP1664_15700 [Zafaria cholistanensis]
MQDSSSDRRIPMVAGVESTYLPAYDVDISDATGHTIAWRNDLESIAAAGVQTVRYPIRWHRVERRPGHYDWGETDRVLEFLHARGTDVIVDLLHHTSYPRWLDDGFRDARFRGSYLRFAEAVARRYPWLRSYTLFNEPFATLFLTGHEALWPPYDRGIEGFARLAANVLPAISEASACWSELLPRARHVWVDTCEHHAGTPGGPAEYAALANDRRHVLLDLVLGHQLEATRPFLSRFLAAGAEHLVGRVPVRVDVVGLDYYCHSEWWYDESGSMAPSPRPVGFAALAEQYFRRYGLPVMLTETNIRGLPTDKASWLRHTLEQYELAVARGVDLRGYCWFPHVDSCDWDSLLARAGGRVDPVGVYSLGAEGQRLRTSFTDAWEAVAAGKSVAELPAYRFQAPCDRQLRGFVPLMAHWPWTDLPATEIVPPLNVKEPPMNESVPDLAVLSHLRWTWVWQRPQQLVSRFAARRAAAGARTWFIEEPVPGEVAEPRISWEDRDGITRVWLVVPDGGRGGHIGFDDPRAESYPQLLQDFLQARTSSPDVLVYTPMALDAAHALKPGRICYDVMDDLASFLGAPEAMKLRQHQLLAEADVVFTGGRSLHEGIRRHRRTGCHLFPSGVDSAHFETARRLRATRGGAVPPTAGYVGVIDERVDLDLIAGVAAHLPDWHFRIVGPVTKIDPASLPQAANIEYPGMADYARLPEIMAGFDVALMPFALNEATRRISPTKTLEYLAAGLPVVSTRVPDVVTDYTGIVRFADTAQQFAQAVLDAAGESRGQRDSASAPLRERHEWDSIAEAMHERICAQQTTDAEEESAKEAGA